MNIILDPKKTQFLEEQAKYLPFDIFKIDGRYFVSWRPIPPSVFERGFFDDQIKYQASINSSGIVTTIESFIHIDKELKFKNKPKLIFHTSRCGSTLLMNILNIADNHLVFQEPNIINQFTLDIWTSSHFNNDEKQQILRGIFKSLIHYASEFGLELFIKLSSFNLLLADFFLKTLLSPPSIFLYRDVISVEKSLKLKSNSFLDLETSSKLLSILSSKCIPGKKLDNQEYIKIIFKALKKYKGLDNTYSYEKLFNQNNIHNINGALSKLDVPSKHIAHDKIIAELGFYSKDKTKTMRYNS